MVDYVSSCYEWALSTLIFEEEPYLENQCHWYQVCHWIDDVIRWYFRSLSLQTIANGLWATALEISSDDVINLLTNLLNLKCIRCYTSLILINFCLRTIALKQKILDITFNSTASFNRVWIQILLKFKPCSRHIRDFRWWWKFSDNGPDWK